MVRQFDQQLSSYDFVQQTLTQSANKHRIRVSLIKHNRLPSIFQSLGYNDLNELFGTYHIKHYVVDDDVILTGANISRDYFSIRTDRYLHCHECAHLADYVYEFNQIFTASDELAIANTEELVERSTVYVG